MARTAPLLRIDLDARLPVYQQIVDGLRALLVSGEFAPGDLLPTMRQLATDLGVHHNTVAEAYRILAEEGWLDLKRGRGARVQPRRAPGPTPRAHASFARRLRELIAQALADGVPAQEVLETAREAAHTAAAQRTAARAATRKAPRRQFSEG
jgi:GntR family transcriptional regulator